MAMGEICNILLMAFIICANVQSQGSVVMQPDGEMHPLLENTQILERVKRIEIMHIPPHIESPIAIRREVIDQGGFYKIIIYGVDNIRASFEKAIRSVIIKEIEGGSDLRWALVLMDSQGNRLLSIYFNENGDKGYVDSTPVSFKGKLFRWIKSNFSISIKN
jgi:hypothetical protein